MTTKGYLRHLVDELPDSQLEVALRFLEYLRDTSDPVLHALLTAPEDDEIENDEELRLVDEAKQELRRGGGLDWDEVRKSLALSSLV